MTDDTLADRVRANTRSELDRLGSDKALIAATHADLATEPVLRTVADELGALATALREWTEKADSGAAETFRDVAEDADQHRDRIQGELDGDVGDGASEVVDRLSGLESDVEAVGGLLGQALVLDRTLLQVINFFVNEADERRADLARDVRQSAKSWAEDAGALLEDDRASEEDHERARAAAVDVIEDAYEEYVATLEGMGIDPKPVC